MASPLDLKPEGLHYHELMKGRRPRCLVRCLLTVHNQRMRQEVGQLRLIPRSNRQPVKSGRVVYLPETWNQL